MKAYAKKSKTGVENPQLSVNDIKKKPGVYQPVGYENNRVVVIDSKTILFLGFLAGDNYVESFVPSDWTTNQFIAVNDEIQISFSN